MSKKKHVIQLTDSDIQKGWVDVSPSVREVHSRTIGVRLSDADTREAVALKIFDELPRSERRKFVTNAIIAHAGRGDVLSAPSIKVDSGAFAQEVALMREGFNRQIDELSNTIVAMFETMQKAGVAVNIETPPTSVEKREIASNIVNAYKGRYGNGG